MIGGDGERYYGPGAINVIASSVSCEPYAANWYRRPGMAEDPWISIRSHGDPNGHLMVYGGSSNVHHTELLKTSGMGVYIRRRPTCDPSTMIGDFE